MIKSLFLFHDDSLSRYNYCKLSIKIKQLIQFISNNDILQWQLTPILDLRTWRSYIGYIGGFVSQFTRRNPRVLFPDLYVMYRKILEFCFLIYKWCIVKSMNFVSCFMLDVSSNPWILFPALCLIYCEILEFCFLLYAWCIEKSLNFVSCFMPVVS